MSRSLVEYNPSMVCYGEIVFKKTGKQWSRVVPIPYGKGAWLAIASLGGDDNFREFLNRRKAIRNARKRAIAETKAQDWRAILAR